MQRKTTLKDIALQAGTSANTVSKALRNHPQVSEAKRNEILELAEKMGYIPNLAAKNLRQRNTNFIGLIVCDNTNPYFAKTIRLVQNRLKANDYYTLIFNNNEDIEDELVIISEMCSLNVAGVLLTPARSNSESIKQLEKYKIPYVLLSRRANMNQGNSVVADDVQAGYAATKHLLSRKPPPVFFMNYLKSVETTKQRQIGYELALREHGIEPRPEWVHYDCIDNVQAFEIMNRWLPCLKPPFSVLCYSDYIAQGILSSMYKNNISVPGQVSVMGIDDTESLISGPYAISTVQIPIERIAREGVDLLLKIIRYPDQEQETKEQNIVLEPKLVVRHTT